MWLMISSWAAVTIETLDGMDCDILTSGDDTLDAVNNVHG
jgi:hypothetical protein